MINFYKILIFIFILQTFLFAQSKSITGLIVDAETNIALNGANIYVLNFQVGTVSDNEGFFKLDIPPNSLGDTVVVSYLGYKDYKAPISQMKEKMIIKLIPQILPSENEISILADKINLSKKEIPHVSHTINAIEIENYGTTEISDLFKLDPSVQVEGNELDGKYMQIRGSDADEVNIYIDGILLNTIGINNEADLSIIPTENIKKIEILKGANLMLLGNGAFGGVVNITTKNILNTQFSTNMKYGSSQSKYLSAGINTPIYDNIFFNYFGMWNELFPEIEFFATERFTEKTESNSISSTKQSHNISLNYFTKKTQLTTKMIGYILDYSNSGWYELKKNLLIASSFKGELFSLPEFNLSAHYAFNTDRIKRMISNNQYYQNEYISQRFNLRGSKNINIVNEDDSLFDLQFLSEYYHDEVATDNDFKSASGASDLYNNYLYDNRASLATLISFGNNADSSHSFMWKTFAGIRGDFLANGQDYKTNNFGFQFSYNAKSWKLSPFLSYGENIKFPSLLEYAFMTDIQDIAITTNNDSTFQIKPEHTESSELGTKFSYEPMSSFFNRLDFEMTFFSTKVYNKIDERPITGILIKTQMGENTLNGMEIALSLNEIYSNFNLSSALTIIDISNPRIYTYKPDVKFNIKFDYQSLSGFYFNSTYFYEGKSTGIEYNKFNELEEDIISPFFDFDISLGYRFKFQKLKLNAQLSGYNILDSSGYKYYYLKKRYLQASLGISY